MPEGTSEDRLGQLYVVPQQQGVVLEGNKAPFPPSVGVQDDANIASLQTLDQQFWVMNAKAPAVTWSQLLSFLRVRQIAVIDSDLSTATIQTGWFQQAVQPGYATRYQLRLERGLQTDATEIFITNEKASLADIAADSVTHRHPSNQLQDRAHGLWFANEVVRVFNDPDIVVSNSYLANTINLPEKVRLTTLDQESVMYVTLDNDRLHRAIEKALDQNGLQAYGQDVQKFVYYFDEYQSDDSPSRWWNPFSWSSTGDSKRESPYGLNEILSQLPDEPAVNQLFPDVSTRQVDKKLVRVPGYLLVKREKQGKTTLYVRDAYGRPLTLNRSRELLDTIRLRLI